MPRESKIDYLQNLDSISSEAYTADIFKKYNNNNNYNAKGGAKIGENAGNLLLSNFQKDNAEKLEYKKDIQNSNFKIESSILKSDDTQKKELDNSYTATTKRLLEVITHLNIPPFDINSPYNIHSLQIFSTYDKEKSNFIPGKKMPILELFKQLLEKIENEQKENNKEQLSNANTILKRKAVNEIKLLQNKNTNNKLLETNIDNLNKIFNDTARTLTKENDDRIRRILQSYIDSLQNKLSYTKDMGEKVISLARISNNGSKLENILIDMARDIKNNSNYQKKLLPYKEILKYIYDEDIPGARLYVRKTLDKGDIQKIRDILNNIPNILEEGYKEGINNPIMRANYRTILNTVKKTLEAVKKETKQVDIYENIEFKKKKAEELTKLNDIWKKKREDNRPLI